MTDPLIHPQPPDHARDFRYRAETLSEDAALMAEQALVLDLASNLLVTHSPGAVLEAIRQMRLELPKDGTCLRRRAIHLTETMLEGLARADLQASQPEPVSDEPLEPGMTWYRAEDFLEPLKPWQPLLTDTDLS